MAENSKIEWCHHTVNLWWGCTEVHAGCDHCYAKTLAHRRKPHLQLWGKSAPRLIIHSAMSDLAKYQRKANAAGEMHRIFINSMSDIFEKDGESLINQTGEMYQADANIYPTWISALRDELFENISNGLYPNLIFLLLTKRPSNINKMIPKEWLDTPPENVMFGTSPVDQETWDKLWLQLSRVKGWKFVSMEPMLSSLKMKVFAETEYNFPDWVICGGESGPGKRPFDADWAREIKRSCNAAGIPFFMKQMDKVIEIPEDLFIRQVPAFFNKKTA